MEKTLRAYLASICNCWEDGLGQTGRHGSSVLLFVGMNLLVQNHNHNMTAKAIIPWLRREKSRIFSANDS